MYIVTVQYMHTKWAEGTFNKDIPVKVSNYKGETVLEPILG